MKKIKIPVLEISNLFAADRRCSIEHFNIHIPYGDSLAVLCDKDEETELLFEVLSGKIKPKKGKVFFKGNDVTGERNSFGVVFREPKLSKIKTVTEYAAVPIVKRGLSGKMSDVLVRKELCAMNLEDYADRKISSLPQNIAIRTELFAAYMCSHELIAIDEPFASLDSEERDAEIQRLIQLKKNIGISLLVFTDNVDIAVQLADVVAVVGEKFEFTGMIGVDSNKIDRTIKKIEELMQ